MNILKKLALVGLLFGAVTFVGCNKEEDPAKDAKDKVEGAAKDAKEAVKDATKK